MKKKIPLLLFALSLFCNCYPQKPKEVIEDGIRIGKSELLFLKLQSDNISYQVSDKKDDHFNPKLLPDSTIFCIHKSGINIHMRPINPLRFVFKSEQKEIDDPISREAAVALTDLIGKIPANPAPGLAPPGKTKNQQKAYDESKKVLENYEKDKIKKRTALIDIVTKIKEEILKDLQQQKIAAASQTLIKMDFAAQQATEDILTNSKNEITAVTAYFDGIAKSIDNLSKEVEKYDFDDSFTIQYIFKDLIDKLKDLLAAHKKRLTILSDFYTICDNVRLQAKSNEDGIPWNLKIGNSIKVQRGKIINYNITIKKGGYEFDIKKNEIVSKSEEAYVSRMFRLRRFNRFVPEISAGIAYTFFEVTKYGTDTIAGGQMVIAEAGKEAVRNVNFTGMINFTYFSEESDVHPFLQIGAGINTKAPTILFGGGVRFNVDGLRRFSISGGIAMSWIKRLDKLKVGDKISGTAELEKDLKDVFNWPPKPYIGLQYNF